MYSFCLQRLDVVLAGQSASPFFLLLDLRCVEGSTCFPWESDSFRCVAARLIQSARLNSSLRQWHRYDCLEQQ